MKPKERIDEINLVRAFAIIGVLMVHSTSFAVTETLGSSLYPLYNFANIFFKFGTPTFILLSSLVLFYTYYDRPADRSLFLGFYKKRLMYILLPYLIFSIGYYALRHYWYYADRPLDVALADFVDKLLTGKAYAHLYFVFISVQFYVLFPLLLYASKKWPLLTKGFIPFGFAVQWGFVLLNHYWLSVPNKGSWALSYFAYYFTGAYFGISFDRIREWLKPTAAKLKSWRGPTWALLWAGWLAFGLSHVWIWYVTRHDGRWFNTLWYELLWNLHTFCTALVLIQVAFLLREWNREARVVRLLDHLGVMSFGIYLFHPLVLFYYRLHPVTATYWFHLWYAGGFVLALTLSWLVVTLAFRFIPFAWVLFGNVPARYTGLPKPSAERSLSVGR
ncbi:MAG: acyltransferase [Thermobacillus sp. ZCTH02-B1]|uniref:acyltransferase n=1 Tax=Thermobacillus sp. ZCTH02-B1 TaxID=1858795 RepID=UPI000B56BB6F|nr:acyltransferase [Thermobacillus sp. ZCTH02-B1]OUM95732.1 MAG: acyltransferase [Thermobacillus sp. ZCTH02-B1]